MFKTLKILLFILICMAGCQKHIVEPDVQEVYIEKIDTNQKYQITCKEEACRGIINELQHECLARRGVGFVGVCNQRRREQQQRKQRLQQSCFHSLDVFS